MAQPRPRGGPSRVIMIISAVVAVVGAVSFTNAVFGTDDILTRIVYGFIFIMSFSFVFLSMFRVRRRYSISSVVPFKVLSIVRCAQCSFKQLRNFTPGDYVDKTEGLCTQCGTGNLFINGIYTEGPPHR